MNHGSIHLMRLFGIPIRIHVSWLIIFFLITWSLAVGYFPQQEAYKGWPPHVYWVAAVVTSLLFFTSVLLHELAHSLVALSRGMHVRDIVLFVFGGVSEITEEPASPGTEFVMTFVGPGMSFLLGGFFYIIHGLVAPISQPAGAVAFYLFVINLMLGFFNLIPGFPLDGGRLLRSIVWAITGNLQRATWWAVRMGQFISYAFIFGGIWMVFTPGGAINGLWLAFIGWFLNNAAQASWNQTLIKHALAGHGVREIMTADFPQVPPDLSVAALVDDYILGRGLRSLPVTQDGRLLGLVSVHHIKNVPLEQRNTTRVSDIMLPAEKLQVTQPDEGLWRALEEMTEEGVNQLPVVEGERLAGMLRRDAVMGFLRIRAELGG